MKLDKQTAQALTNLRANQDFKQLSKWLGEHREKFRDECSTAEGPPLFRAQGKVHVVDALFKALDEAPELSIKFRKQER